MAERKPPGMGFESWVDQQIREATERGEFDNLPGAGEPIPGQGMPEDENWWLRAYLAREQATDAALPTPLQLRREIEQLPDNVRGLRSEDDVREVVKDLNWRVLEWLRFPSGPQVPVRPVDEDGVVERWRADRATTESTTTESTTTESTTTESTTTESTTTTTTTTGGAAGGATAAGGSEPTARVSWWRRILRRTARRPR